MASRYGGQTVCILRDEGEDTAEGLELNFREMGIYDGVTFVHDGGDPLPLIERGLAAVRGPETLLLVEAGSALQPGVMERLGSTPRRTTVVFFGDITIGAEPEPLANLDAALTFDVARARAGLFPAVDVFRSYSHLPLSEEHARVASAVRRTLRRAADLYPAIEKRGEAILSPEDAVIVGRAERLSRFLTQPIRGAEPWTNRPGTLVSLNDTIQGCAAILNGERDALPAEALHSIGSLLDR
jgi:F-type H+-transporting ATPase subunit beta